MDNLTISQLDPTSKCGNGCKHCGDSANMKGLELSPEDVDLLFQSGHFRLRPKSRLVPDLGTKINLLGGGDPTYHSDLPNFLRSVSRYANFIGVLTGGFNPHMDKDHLETVLREFAESGIHVRFNVTYHPYGYLSDENRIRDALLFISRAPLAARGLKVLCFPESVEMPVQIRSLFPVLTEREILETDFFRWVRENFAIFENARRTNPDGSPRSLPNPFLDVDLTAKPLRRTGRACTLPLILSDGLTTRERVERFLSDVHDGASNNMRVTAEGHITACFTSKFTNLDMNEGDLRGHSFEEIVANRVLLITHYVREAEAWLRSNKETEQGSICDTVCKRAREAFALDKKRIPSHRGQGQTVLPVKNLKAA
ncbi:MAG: radical SAM protein [Candidatus Micrarchaeota archaeon]